MANNMPFPACFSWPEKYTPARAGSRAALPFSSASISPELSSPRRRGSRHWCVCHIGFPLQGPVALASADCANFLLHPCAVITWSGVMLCLHAITVRLLFFCTTDFQGFCPFPACVFFKDDLACRPHNANLRAIAGEGQSFLCGAAEGLCHLLKLPGYHQFRGIYRI